MLNSCVMLNHTGSAPGIIVWGGIGYHSRTPLVRITGTLNSQRYISEVLVPVVLPYLHALATAISQQDNTWPHDLPPIENVWSMVAQRLTQITPQLPHEINFGNVWKLLGLLYSQEHIQSLFESLPRLMAVVISNNGGYSGY
ncbi:transposable element Tc1 transposase [Trichonephila clavipes]|nr:transposable element Tc1 transposase [Trichonephila clavipes]